MTGTALIIVDVQNDFLPPTGSLAVTDGRSTLPHIQKFLDSPEWIEKWDPVVATQDWHPRGHISFASAHEGGKPYTKIQVPKRTTDPSPANRDAGDDEEMVDMFIWPDHCVRSPFLRESFI
jgi:nicotinamidase